MATTIPAPPPPRADVPMRGFELIEEDSEAGIRELRLRGELDLAVSGRLAGALADAAAARRSVLIDLGDCEFIDSTAIAVLVRGRAALTNEGLRAAACRPTGQVKRVLDLVGLSDHGVVFAGRDEAMDALRQA